MATRSKKRKAEKELEKDAADEKKEVTDNKEEEKASSSTRSSKKRKVEEKKKDGDEKGKKEVDDSSSNTIDTADSAQKIKTLLDFNGKSLKTDKEFLTKFEGIANALLNDVILYINEKPHRLDEIEFYYHAHAHQDIFAHCDPMQTTSTKWYFHKKGSNYKGGTYKGMDITFGEEEKGKFGGILIRSLESLPIPTKPKILDGPCVCVDYILKENGSESIANFVEDFGGDLDVTTTKRLYLKYASTDDEKKLLGPHREVCSGPRVGLSLKKGDSAQYRFVMKNYRFLSQPRLIKKGKPHIVAGLLGHGVPLDKIIEMTGVTKDSAKSYSDSYESGKKNNKPSDFEGKALENEEVLNCYGNCYAIVNV